MIQRMPLQLTVSCFSKIQIGFSFWYRLIRVVSDKGPLNVCVCVCVFQGVQLPPFAPMFGRPCMRPRIHVLRSSAVSCSLDAGACLSLRLVDVDVVRRRRILAPSDAARPVRAPSRRPGAVDLPGGGRPRRSPSRGPAGAVDPGRRGGGRRGPGDDPRGRSAGDE